MSGNSVKRPMLLSMDSVEEREPEWLVPQYIPKGQINVLAGDGGSGKTITWCGLAAAVSSGNILMQCQRNLLNANLKRYCFLVPRILLNIP